MKRIVMLTAFFGFLFGCKAQDEKINDFDGQRQKMVNFQIKNRGIDNPSVLKAFLQVKRHRFVLPEYMSESYADHPLPIGEGQTISQPYVVAFMTDALQLNEKMRVLEIGTGSGYQAAILSVLCDSVYTIEIFPSLGNKAKQVLSDLGHNNVQVKVGDGYKGWPDKAPFDAIIVTCAPSHIPKPLQDQLAEGGRMIIPVGGSFTQELILLSKLNGIITTQDVLPVRFVPMLKKSGKKY